MRIQCLSLLSSSLDTALNAVRAETTPSALVEQLGRLVAGRLAKPPAPGSGSTLERWRCLARVAAHDLSLIKLYEGHADALAILAEAHCESADDDRHLWGCWAAEAPGKRVLFRGEGDSVVLDGVKAWCSGAEHLDRGLLTVWSASGEGPFLAAVDM
jgi:alkylation response protein AidB-like acyl-CoA dehydrogenase